MDMTEQTFFDSLLVFWFMLALVVFSTLFFLPAPYGRYVDKKVERSIPNRWAWMIMESPAVFGFGAMFLLGNYNDSVTVIVFLSMWTAHYVQRTFMYPFLIRGEGKRMPFHVVVLAFLFNLVNGYLNGRYLFEFSGGYPNEWLIGLPFLFGASLFIIGYTINRHADWVLRSLREPGESGYRIPHGGLYRWISCPNYFGEIMEWTGWALATWSLAGLAFAVWTVANLAPRCWSHHKWYRAHFDNYPPERKALLPWLW